MIKKKADSFQTYVKIIPNPYLSFTKIGKSLGDPINPTCEDILAKSPLCEKTKIIPIATTRCGIGKFKEYIKLQKVLAKKVFLIANAPNKANAAAKKVLTKLTHKFKPNPVQNNFAYLSENITL